VINLLNISIIKKFLTPILKNVGYHFYCSTPYYVRYCDSCETREISINYSSGDFININIVDREMGFFRLSDFEERAASAWGYSIISYHSELEMLEHTAEMIHTMFSYLDNLKPFMVHVNEDMYHKLATNTIDKAISFRQNSEPQIDISYYDKIMFVQDKLLKLRGQEIQYRKKIFSNDIDYILSAAAFLGELYAEANSEKECRWQWLDITNPIMQQIYRSQHLYVMKILFGDYADPLKAIIYLWNHHPVIPRAELQNF
jgi:hypothetical protein